MGPGRGEGWPREYLFNIHLILAHTKINGGTLGAPYRVSTVRVLLRVSVCCFTVQITRTVGHVARRAYQCSQTFSKLFSKRKLPSDPSGATLTFKTVRSEQSSLGASPRASTHAHTGAINTILAGHIDRSWQVSSLPVGLVHV